mmetsp:Transcript_29367/g.73355  ORF Transcript_29367/g.73355 Transcript_29367/m.73355 type:complete len:479 (-) Transcript_29367:394-1830(-)
MRKLSSTSAFCFAWCSASSWFTLLSSMCRLALPRSSCLTSLSCTSVAASIRLCFCMRIDAFARLSCSCSLTDWLLFATLTSSVCALIHTRCRSEFSATFVATSRFKCTIVASRGPASSSSSAIPARCFISASNFLFNRSSSCCFFSISVLRRLASSSYLAISESFSVSSSFNALSCEPSCVLCDMVLSVSTRIRASSFCMLAAAISISSLCARSFSVAWLVFAAPFSTASCSPRLFIALSCSFFESSSVFWICASSALTSCSSAASCCTIFDSSASVCSSDLLSIANFSWWRSSFSLHCARLASTIRASESSLFSVPVSSSFLSSSCLIAFFTPATSASSASSCSRCLFSASSVACSASSRRCIPMSATFHCCSSCFFSKLIASISALASLSVCVAALVSPRCEMSCASVSASSSCARRSCSLSESISMSCCFLPPSSVLIDSSALYVARRVTAISDFICSLYASTCLRVMCSWSSSD